MFYLLILFSIIAFWEYSFNNLIMSPLLLSCLLYLSFIVHMIYQKSLFEIRYRLLAFLFNNVFPLITVVIAQGLVFYFVQLKLLMRNYFNNARTQWLNSNASFLY